MGIELTRCRNPSQHNLNRQCVSHDETARFPTHTCSLVKELNQYTTRLNRASFFRIWHSFRHVTFRFVCSLDTLQIAINYVSIRRSFLWYATTRHIPTNRNLIPSPQKAKSLHVWHYQWIVQRAWKAAEQSEISVSTCPFVPWNGTTLLPPYGCWKDFALGTLIKICG
jgi:hypothetical protein